MAISLAGNLTKKAHTVTNYSIDQINELKKCMDPINGPLYFMTHFFYITTDTGIELYNPYKFQYRLIDAYHNYIKSISLCPRQVGKCLEKNSKIKIRNKKTGEIQEIEIEKFYNMTFKLL